MHSSTEEVWAPIFTPSMAEFRDFATYVQNIRSKCTTGICKIIPPKEWNGSFNYDKVNVEIPTPIRQYVSGSKGLFQLALIEVRNRCFRRETN